MSGRVLSGGPIDPSLLAAIGDLELLARTVVEGFLHGHHRSSQHGLSVDFAEHRSYQPGDDPRRIDWRLYGRTERLFMKLHEAETTASVQFALDRSRSMAFGSGPLDKSGWATALVASLAWLAQRQGDRVGLLPVGSERAEYIPPSARHLPLVLQSLARTRPDGTQSLGESLVRAARTAGRPGLVVIASDCYDSVENIVSGAGMLVARGHDVILFRVVDRVEREFNLDQAQTLADLETDERIALRPELVRSDYLEEFAAHDEELGRRLGNEGVDWLSLTTDEPLDRALHNWLAHRRRPAAMR